MKKSSLKKSGFTRTPKFGVTPKGGGFTLIELLVVISIISLLSSIVLASLNTARTKAKEAALKLELIEFRSLLELEFSNTGSYIGLASITGGWANDPIHTYASSCDTLYPLSSTASIYIPQANALCKKIVEISFGGSYALYVSLTASTFSVQSWFGSNNLIYCVGGSGVTFGKAWGDGPPTPDASVVYNNLGCSANP